MEFDYIYQCFVGSLSLSLARDWEREEACALIGMVPVLAALNCPV
jgi:hypothetical protein